MNIAEVKEAIGAAIRSERANVIGLVGDWGVGKTHLWKEYVVENREKLAEKYEKYAYVSLFGLTSAKDIRAAILDKLIPTKLVTADPGETIKEQAKEQVKRRHAIRTGFLKRARELLKHSDSGWSGIGSEAIDMAIAGLEYRAAQSALLCFDDLERLSPSFSTSDVMGLIDGLARERGCKVVVIFSPENMGGPNAEVLVKYREKLFDRELRLNPPISFCLEIGCRGLDESAKVVISSAASRLGLKNIRIVRRIVDGLLDIRTHVPKMNDDVEANIATSLVLLTYCHLISKPDVPSLDEVVAIPFVGSDSEEGPSPHHEFLKAYGWIGFQEPDPWVTDYVRNGTCDWGGLTAFIEAANHENSTFKRVQRVREPWREYHNRFMNEEELREFCSRFAARHIEEIGVVDTQTVDGAMDLLRGANEPVLANSVFAAWKEAHAQDRAKLDLDHVEAHERIYNCDLRDFCVQQFEHLAPPTPKDVREVLVRMSRDRSWGGDDTALLVAASVDDYVTAMRQGTVEIRHAVQHLIKANAEEQNYGVIAQSLKAALLVLAAESPVNRWKAKAFGVEVV